VTLARNECHVYHFVFPVRFDFLPGAGICAWLSVCIVLLVVCGRVPRGRGRRRCARCVRASRPALSATYLFNEDRRTACDGRSGLACLLYVVAKIRVWLGTQFRCPLPPSRLVYFQSYDPHFLYNTYKHKYLTQEPCVCRLKLHIQATQPHGHSGPALPP
jgi:hypothetical protein